MTTQSRQDFSDPPSPWSMNQQSLDNAEAVFRAWCELSGRARENATKFMSSRWAKDTVALAQLGQCKTPVDAMNVQMAYLTGVYADYMSEGHKIVGFLSDVARETLPGMFVDQKSAKSKPSPRRVASS